MTASTQGATARTGTRRRADFLPSDRNVIGMLPYRFTSICRAPRPSALTVHEHGRQISFRAFSIRQVDEPAVQNGLDHSRSVIAGIAAPDDLYVTKWLRRRATNLLTR